MAARRDQQRLADPHHVGQRVVRVPGQDHVDALDARGKLAVDVEAVVGQQHHEVARRRSRAFSTFACMSSSRMPNDQFGIIQRGLAMGV